MSKQLLSAVIALSLCTPLFAASAVSEDDIYAWLKLWQKREGLEQRDIRLRIVRASEMPRNITGDVEWWAVPGLAQIRVVRPDDLERVYGDTAVLRNEIECTVVHELMHLVLAGLYDAGDGRGSALLSRNPVSDHRMEAITENLTVMLLRRRTPNGLSVARYISRQINGGPWTPAREVRERIMLQVARAMNAANEDDVVILARR